jgi:hypothetical protein
MGHFSVITQGAISYPQVGFTAISAGLLAHVNVERLP